MSNTTSILNSFLSVRLEHPPVPCLAPRPRRRRRLTSRGARVLPPLLVRRQGVRPPVEGHQWTRAAPLLRPRGALPRCILLVLLTLARPSRAEAIFSLSS